jgi:phosphoribosylglycinamide formyltransferase 1
VAGAQCTPVNKLELPTIAILASGSGTTAEYVVRATQTGVLRARIGLVVCNNLGAGVFGRIERLNKQYGLQIPAVHVNGKTHPAGTGGRGEQTLEESEAIVNLCKGIDLVVLLGYMKKVTGRLLDLPMVNTHPGPLPETAGLYGLHVQEHVLESNLGYSAQTLHWVTGDYDRGEVIAVHHVPVALGDTAETLFDAVQATEKAHLPTDLDALLHGGMLA